MPRMGMNVFNQVEPERSQLEPVLQALASAARQPIGLKELDAKKVTEQ
jgi:hypothetical protein